MIVRTADKVSRSMIRSKDMKMRKRRIVIYKAWDNINLGKAGGGLSGRYPEEQGAMDFSFPLA